LEDLLFSAGLPVWWAVSFAVAAVLLRRIKSGVPGRRLFFAIIILAVFAMFSLMPYLVLFLAAPLLIVFMFAPKWWFRVGVFVTSLSMAAGLHLAFAQFTADRKEAKALLLAMIDDDSGAWKDSLARIVGEWPAEPAPELPAEKALTGMPGGRDRFVSDSFDGKMAFAPGRESEGAAAAGLNLALPIPEGYALDASPSSDGSLAVLVFRGAKGDRILAVFPDSGGTSPGGPDLEAVRAAYADTAALEHGLAPLVRLFENAGWTVSLAASPEAAQNSEGMVASRATAILTPNESVRRGGDFGIDVDLLGGAVVAGGTSRRFWLLVMCDNMESGLQTAVTWLNRLAAENPAADRGG
jgi:hypothetical protein